MINVVARAGPADDETLTPDDAADVLEGLLPAQTKSYELGLKLKLTQLIHSKDIPADQYIRRILIEFLQQVNLRPTWRVIVEALRSPLVNLPGLARRAEAAHFPDTTSTHYVVQAETTTGMLRSAPLIYTSSLTGNVSINSDTTESAGNTTAGDDEQVKSKPFLQLNPANS